MEGQMVNAPGAISQERKKPKVYRRTILYLRTAIWITGFLLQKVSPYVLCIQATYCFKLNKKYFSCPS